MSNEEAALRGRLKNCIKTILELEDEFLRAELVLLFEREFSELKRQVECLKSYSFNEEDVRRIETATDRFLLELKFFLAADYSQPRSDSSRILQ